MLRPRLRPPAILALAHEDRRRLPVRIVPSARLEAAVAPAEDDLVAFEEPEPEQRQDVAGRRLLDAPRLGRHRPPVGGGRHELRDEVGDPGRARVRQDGGPDALARRDEDARDEAGHRAAVAGEHPLPVPAEAEPQSVPAGPALVVVDRLHRPHLLDRGTGEHRFVRIGEERRPATEVAHRPPELAGRDPRAGLYGRLLPHALDVRLDEVSGRSRLLGVEARPRQPERTEQPLLDILRVRPARHPLDDYSEQREREVRVVEAPAGRQMAEPYLGE